MRKVNSNCGKALLCLCLMVCAASAFAAKKSDKAKNKAAKMPEWINQPSAVYPNSAYITYVGNAADRSASEVNALQGLAAIFGQSVKSDSTANSRMTQAKENGLVANANVQTFSQEVKRKVDVDNLVGVETKEYWQDAANGTWYAIAVLDKAKAADIYAEMIKKNASAIDTVLNNIGSDKNSFDAFGAYYFAEEIAVENEKHLNKISVIDNSLTGGLKSYCPSSKNLHAKKMEIAKNIPINIQTFNDEHGRYKQAFSKAVADAGFKGTFDDSVRYTLIAKFEFERSDTTDKKTVRCRYNCESYIVDATTGHQIVPFTVKGRESHVNYEEAQRKAEGALVEKIKKDFSEALYSYIRSAAE